MTGFQIYWIMQLDIIHNIILAFLAVVVFAIMVLIILLITHAAGKNDSQENKKSIADYLKKLVLALIIILPFAILVPDTNTALMSSVVPRLNDAEKAKLIPKEFKEFTQQRLMDLGVDRD